MTTASWRCRPARPCSSAGCCCTERSRARRCCTARRGSSAQRLPRDARDALIGGDIAIGIVLRAHQLETFRVPLRVGVRAAGDGAVRASRQRAHVPAQVRDQRAGARRSWSSTSSSRRPASRRRADDARPRRRRRHRRSHDRAQPARRRHRGRGRRVRAPHRRDRRRHQPAPARGARADRARPRRRRSRRRRSRRRSSSTTIASATASHSEPRGRAAGYRWPQFSIHRGELQRLLLRRRPRRGSARTPCAAGWRWRASSRRATACAPSCANARPGARSRSTADVLIGADGIDSAVRAQLHPGEGAPRWAGHRHVARRERGRRRS